MKKKFWYFLIVLGWILLGTTGHLWAQTMDDHSTAHDHSATVVDQSVELSVRERIGFSIPQEIKFRDATGRLIAIGDMIDRPTILLPVYYNCPGVCGLMMSSLAMVVNRLTGVEWDDYRIISFSFDAEDTPEMAKQAKATYLNLLDPSFPEQNWRFLVGEQSAIDRLHQSIGYSVIKQDQHLFSHPNVLMVLSAEGKIMRYIYGPHFLPFDVGMAITEAEKGRYGVSVKKVLSFCFSYDQEEKRYVFQYIRIFGLVIPLLLLLFYIFFLRQGNKPKRQPK